MERPKPQPVYLFYQARVPKSLKGIWLFVKECTCIALTNRKKIRIDKRADNNLELFIVRRTKLPPWLLGHQWSGNSPGARLRQSRVTNNMTIRDLCAVTGLSDVTIKNLESDKFNASLSNLRKFAKVLRVSIEYLGCFEMLPENTLAQRITKARLFYGFTKEEFAPIIGVDVKTLRNWEQGKHVPLSRYSDVLNQYLEVLKE